MSKTWSHGKKKSLSYRTSPSGCLWILRLFSFRTEEGRRGFEEEVGVSSTASIATTTTSSCSLVKPEHRIKTAVAVENGPKMKLMN